MWKSVFKNSKGIPRVINILCHKALLITYGYNKKKITPDAIAMAITDTDDCATISSRQHLGKLGIILLLLAALGIGSYFILTVFFI